jgi:hypothetical protein
MRVFGIAQCGCALRAGKALDKALEGGMMQPHFAILHNMREQLWGDVREQGRRQNDDVEIGNVRD